MKTIHKYKLSYDLHPYPFVNLPRGAKILTIAEQGPYIFVWAEVDTSQNLERRQLECFMTGEEIKEDMGVSRSYIKTVFCNNGIVAHFYERL